MRGWMRSTIHLYPSMVIDVTNSVTTAINDGQCPYDCTLSCLKRPVTWSSIDVTYLTTIGPVSKSYAELASYSSVLAEIPSIVLPVIPEYLCSFV